MNAAVARGGDVVLHVANEQRLVRLQMVLAENLVDFFTFVPNAGIGPVEQRAKAGDAALRLEIVTLHRAQKQRAHLFRAAEFQKLPRVRERDHGRLQPAIRGMKPRLQLRHGNVRRMAVVKLREGQFKLRAKFGPRHRRPAGLAEHLVRRLQHGGQVVHQSSRPVENNVADHAGNLTVRTRRRQDKQFGRAEVLFQPHGCPPPEKGPTSQALFDAGPFQ